MSLHTRDCDYCGGLAQWRAADPVPLKCASCGAPPKRAKEAHDALDISILYALHSQNPNAQARLMGAYGAQQGYDPFGMQNQMGNAFAGLGLFR